MVEPVKLDDLLRKAREGLGEPLVLVSDQAVWKGAGDSSEEYPSRYWILLFVSDCLVSVLWSKRVPSSVRKSAYANGFLVRRTCAEAVLGSVYRKARSLVVLQRVQFTGDTPSYRCIKAECFICESELPHAEHAIHSGVRKPYVATAEHEGRAYVCRIYQDEGRA